MTYFKTCTVCKEYKPISEYNSRQKKGQNRYVNGYCKTCEKAKRKAYDAKNYEANREKRRSYDSERCKSPEYKQRQAQYRRNHKKRLTNGIVADLISKKTGLKTADIYKAEGLIEAERSRLLLYRKVKKLESSDPNFRYCSHCGDKKSINEFTYRTENKKGSKSYSYRSGQCKQCIRKIRKEYYGKNKNNRP